MTQKNGLTNLLKTMKSLRDPHKGCPWDLKQTHESLAAYCLEEAHEVVEAIESGSTKNLIEELGDLLLQVVFHAQLLEERGVGSFDQVAETIHQKMVERHPHVFEAGSVKLSADQVLDTWNARKLTKAQNKSTTPVADKLAALPKQLPALQKASRAGEILKSIGFDWSTPQEVWSKIEEETAELQEGVQKQDRENIEEELGDLLFVISQWARHQKLDPEQALRKAILKFQGRIKHMEESLSPSGKKLSELSLLEMEKLWEKSKTKS